MPGASVDVVRARSALLVVVVKAPLLVELVVVVKAPLLVELVVDAISGASVAVGCWSGHRLHVRGQAIATPSCWSPTNIASA